MTLIDKIWTNNLKQLKNNAVITELVSDHLAFLRSTEFPCEFKNNDCISSL